MAKVTRAGHAAVGPIFATALRRGRHSRRGSGLRPSPAALTYRPALRLRPSGIEGVARFPQGDAHDLLHLEGA